MAGSLAVLAAAVIVPHFVRPPDLDENRKLAEPPEPPHDLATLAAWPRLADAYVADHFPPRAHLIGALNALRLKLGVSGSSRTIVGRDRWLFYDNGSHLGAARGEPRLSDADARAWLASLAGRTAALRARGVAYLVLCAPDKEDVYPERGPDWFRLNPDRTAMRLRNLAGQAEAGEMVYPIEELQTAARAGLKVYVPYETHWTGLGAYEGYVALMDRLHALGRTGPPRPLPAFSYLAPPSWGPPRNLALMLGVASFVDVDYPEVGEPARDAALTTTYLTGETDWTEPRVVDTGVVGKPVLLMTMDSFSNALLPFLYGDFSRIILAHDKDGTWRQDLIDRYKPDIVVLEVLESGLSFMMSSGPSPTPEAMARIDAALAHPRREPPRPTPRLPSGRPHPLTMAARPRPRHVIHGTEGDDRLTGTSGPNEIHGGPGNDTITGGPADDILRGGKGNDLINGGPGNDDIWGGLGDDTLIGGPGADHFHAGVDTGRDLILDFNVSEGDRVVLPRGAPYAVRQEGPDTVIEMRAARIVLKGVQLKDLPPGWLIFETGG